MKTLLLILSVMVLALTDSIAQPPLYPFHSGRRWGFCTRDKKIIIPTKFDKVTSTDNFYVCSRKARPTIIFNKYGMALDTAYYVYLTGPSCVLLISPYKAVKINKYGFYMSGSGADRMPSSRAWVIDSNGNKFFIADSITYIKQDANALKLYGIRIYDFSNRAVDSLMLLKPSDTPKTGYGEHLLAVSLAHERAAQYIPQQNFDSLVTGRYLVFHNNPDTVHYYKQYPKIDQVQLIDEHDKVLVTWNDSGAFPYFYKLTANGKILKYRYGPLGADIQLLNPATNRIDTLRLKMRIDQIITFQTAALLIICENKAGKVTIYSALDLKEVLPLGKYNPDIFVKEVSATPEGKEAGVMLSIKGKIKTDAKNGGGRYVRLSLYGGFYSLSGIKYWDRANERLKPKIPLFSRAFYQLRIKPVLAAALFIPVYGIASIFD